MTEPTPHPTQTAPSSTRTVLRLLYVPLAVLVAIGVFSVAKNQGWLSPLGIESESHDTQVINAIERTQEVALVRLSIQGIRDKDQSGTIFGQGIPFSERTVFLQYDFRAKLGIDGEQVKVTKTGDNAFLVSIPEFIFIGYDEPTFKVAVEDDSVLSWVTPDIDQAEMVSEILDKDAQETYLASNEELLRDQAEFFYNSLITSIDPSVETTFEFRS